MEDPALPLQHPCDRTMANNPNGIRRVRMIVSRNVDQKRLLYPWTLLHGTGCPGSYGLFRCPSLFLERSFVRLSQPNEGHLPFPCSPLAPHSLMSATSSLLVENSFSFCLHLHRRSDGAPLTRANVTFCCMGIPAHAVNPGRIEPYVQYFVEGGLFRIDAGYLPT